MTQDKNIGGKIALIIGIVLLVGAATLLIVKLVQRKNEEKEVEPEISKTPVRPTSSSNTSTAQSSGSEQVKRMQSYLLNLGINYGNNEMIDAIRLTGGVDGIKGDGFALALNIAIEKGYVKSYDDLLSRVS